MAFKITEMMGSGPELEGLCNHLGSVHFAEQCIDNGNLKEAKEHLSDVKRFFDHLIEKEHKRIKELRGKNGLSGFSQR